MTTIYFVENKFSDGSTAFPERDPNECDLETTIRDLMSMQFDHPVKVIAVDVEEGWSRDVSEDVAREIAARREPLHHRLIDFIATHAGDALALEMRAA